MDVNAMAKQECYIAFMRLVDKQNLKTQAKLSKALGIKQKDAKDLLNGILDNHEQSDIIKLTAALIKLRLTDGTSQET